MILSERLIEHFDKLKYKERFVANILSYHIYDFMVGLEYILSIWIYSDKGIFYWTPNTGKQELKSETFDDALNVLREAYKQDIKKEQNIKHG